MGHYQEDQYINYGNLRRREKKAWSLFEGLMIKTSQIWENGYTNSKSLKESNENKSKENHDETHNKTD